MSVGIPPGYEAVDPRTARRIPLSHELRADNPLFPGDPPFTHELAATIAEHGYRVERITSLGVHTGTHVSVPSHFLERGATLRELDEAFTLMPLVVLDAHELMIGLPELTSYERQHGPIPAHACVLLRTGFAKRYDARYFEPAPGFTREAVAWLFEQRSIRALGSDTLGPDASSDHHYSATRTTLELGGITVENVGPRLAEMRAHGDWIAINGPRPHFSGFPVGITGFTVW